VIVDNPSRLGTVEGSIFAAWSAKEWRGPKRLAAGNSPGGRQREEPGIDSARNVLVINMEGPDVPASCSARKNFAMGDSS
jgi:hypothetical protein